MNKTNRLAKETSPYLLQHKNNPVDWYAWGEEALQRARLENKPILLSIGYSACHWCHVMAHESFENPEVAALMNENFINIKVDREERPDLDQIYQNVAQVMTRGGGWPLTVFLTPDLKPFFGGTYFPPDDRYGRPGFGRVLVALSSAFQNNSESVFKNAEKLTEVLMELQRGASGDGDGHSTASGASFAGIGFEGIRSDDKKKYFEQISDQFLSRVDWENGGLGGAPKFPNSMIFSFLWRLGLSSIPFGAPSGASDAVRLTLRKMAMGGIYDHLGGGFHRYTVDGVWAIPHFEKMLYDNALLLKLYSEVLLTGKAILSADEKALFVKVVKETVEYVLREMTSAEGMFYSAQDADSEGEEGKFFVWGLDDLERSLSSHEAKVFALRYGVSREGNFEHQKTVLAISRGLDEISEQVSLSEKEVGKLLESAHHKLFKLRSQRVPPGLDNKHLTSWNGLAISGLAWASHALLSAGLESGDQGLNELGEKAWNAAQKAFEFVLAQMGEDRLCATYQGGEPKLNGYLDDYAFMAMAGIDLARWARRSEDGLRWVKQSARWINRVLNHFKDSHAAGYFFTSDDHEALLQRPKTLHDQAIPAGSSVVVVCLVALAQMHPDERLGQRFEQEALQQLGALFPQVLKNSYGFGEACCALWLGFLGPITVTQTQKKDAYPRFITHSHVFQKFEENENIQMERSDGGWIICHQKTCSLPQEDGGAIEHMIQGKLGQEFSKQ